MADSKIASETPTTGSGKKLDIPNRQTDDDSSHFSEGWFGLPFRFRYRKKPISSEVQFKVL